MNTPKPSHAQESVRTWLENQWYGRSKANSLLVALSKGFGIAVTLRRRAYEKGIQRSESLPVPVIVVGNLTVGGTGKTPLVIWLAETLSRAGYKPGIVSRGYGGRIGKNPLSVHPDGDPATFGDEPVLLARRTGCPVFVCNRRMQAARALLELTDCDVIIGDDGLQHYRLARDIEIAVVDGERRFGNGKLLPAGPMREPESRLRGVDFVVCNGRDPRAGEMAMKLTGGMAFNLKDPGVHKPVEEFVDRDVWAFAGIGNPERFFCTLGEYGLNVRKRPFPDHYRYRPEDINPDDDLPVLMTEKDAVKCYRFADERHWYVPVSAQLSDKFEVELLNRLKGKRHG